MTRAQHTIYRAKDGLWANACRVQGWDVKDETRRRAVTLEAARKINPTSACNSTAALNEDQITALFKLLIAYANPLDLAAQRASENPAETKADDECRRLVFAINAAGYHRNYVQKIAEWYCRTHQVAKWEDLPAQKLRLLIITVKKNAGRKVAAAPVETTPPRRDQRTYQMRPRTIYAPSSNPF